MSAPVNIIALALLLLGCLPWRGAHAVERDDLLPLLSGYEWQFDAARFAQLPAGSDQVLMAIAGDAEYAPFLRERAAVVLSLYPTPEVLAFFVASVRSGDAPMLRRGMVQAFCTAFEGIAPDVLEETLIPLLEAEDAHLRVQVARCLGVLGREAANAAIGRYRARIGDNWETRASAP